MLSKQHPLARAGHFDLSDLHSEVLYAIPPVELSGNVPIWEDKIPLKAKVFVPDISNVLINVALGRGFACIPLTFEKSDPADFFRVRVPLDDATADLIAVTRKGIRNDLLGQMVQEISQFCRTNDMISRD